MAIPIHKMFSELSPFGRSQCYLLVSYEYVCFFTLSRNGKTRFLGDSRIEHDNVSQIREFVRGLRRNWTYYGQEIIVLFAEPITFSLIRNAQKGSLDDLRKESNSLFETNDDVHFQTFYTFKHIFHIAFGYDTNFAIRIGEVLRSEGVPVLHYMPLFGFVISEYSFFESGVYEWQIGSLGIIAGINKEGSYLYCEYTDELPDGYRSIIMDRLGDSIEPKVVAGFSKRRMIDNSINDFALADLNSQATGRVLTLIGSCRLLLVASVIISLLLGGTALFFHIKRDNAASIYTEYEDILVEIGTIEERQRAANTKLSSFDDDMTQSMQLSPGMSAFCQKVPSGIVVKDIYAERLNHQGINYQVTGEAGGEQAVFTYRDYINQQFSFDCVKIQSIKRQIDIRDPNAAAVYNFILIGDNKW